MKPIKHLLVSISAGGLFYFYSRSVLASFICFLSGVLIDLDHFCDFYLNYNRLSKNLKEFYLTCTELKFDKIYLFFHSLEVIFLFWILIIVGKLNLIWLAVAVGITLHIMLDIIGNNTFQYSYFLIYRLQKGFRTNSLFKDAL